MKTRLITILAATALAIAALAFAGCDRSIDDINPEPISQGATGPGTAWVTLGGAVPIIEEPEDTTSGGDEDTVIGEDVPDVGDAFADVACSGSDIYCACLAARGNDEEKYGGYCNCMEADQVPSLLPVADYCGCCFFAFSPTYPEYDGNGPDEVPWGTLGESGHCQEVEPPSCETAY